MCCVFGGVGVWVGVGVVVVVLLLGGFVDLVGEVGVVVGHQDVIGGTSHVEFDPVGSLLERRAIGGDGVVGMVRRVATMGDHEGAGRFGAHHLRQI